jgi:hypothetical protein
MFQYFYCTRVTNWVYVRSLLRNRLTFNNSKKLLHIYFSLKEFSEETGKERNYENLFFLVLEENINVLEIYMRGTNRSAYLVVTDWNNSLDKLEKKVSWERHQNNKIFVQFHRCHATSKCHARAKCLKCAGNHLTRDCQLGKKGKPTCANCDGDHTANNITCPEYQKKLEAAQERRNRNSKNEKYVLAPLSKENVWEKRKKNTNISVRGHSEATPSFASVSIGTQPTQPNEKHPR